MFDDLFLFIKLVEAGSFGRVAKMLHIHQSTISRRIEQLETNLKIKLIKETGYGKMFLTDEGKDIFATIQANFAEINTIIENLYLKNKSLHGDFNIIIPAFIHMMVGPIINEFLKLYPDIDVHISNFNADVATYNLPFDVALSFIQPSNPNYLISVLHSFTYSFYASSKYVEKHGNPTNLQDLKNHQVIVPHLNQTPYLNWSAFNAKRNEIETVTLHRHKASYDGSIGGKFLTLAHQGICQLPELMVIQELQENKLVKVLEDYVPAPISLYIIKSDNNFSAKSAAFIEFVKQAIPAVIAGMAVIQN